MKKSGNSREEHLRIWQPRADVGKNTKADERMMVFKIIGIVFGLLAVGIFAWKFKDTSFCRP